MNGSAWRLALHQILTQAPRRLALVSVGQSLRGDDGVGQYLLERLHDLAPLPDVLLLDGASAPENLTGALRRWMPHIIVFVDAIPAPIAPTIQVVACSALAQVHGNSHSLSLGVLAHYLQQSWQCEVYLLGISAWQYALGAPLSAKTRAQADLIYRFCVPYWQCGFVGDIC